MASGSIANLAVMLTAKTGTFARQMSAAQKPLLQLQSTARTVQRGIRLAFGALAVRGLVGALKESVVHARRLGVRIDRISAVRINTLVRSYQALGHVFARLSVRIVATLGPALSRLIDRISALVVWLDRRLTPSTMNVIANVLKFGTAMFVAVSAMSLYIGALHLVTKALKGVAIGQALVQSFSGPKGWISLAIGAGVFAGTLYGINKAFGKLESDASGNLRGIGQEIDTLKNNVMGLGTVAVGRLGVDFMPMSSVRANTDMGRWLASSDSAAAEVRKQTEVLQKQRREDMDIEWSRSWGDGFVGAGRLR